MPPFPSSSPRIPRDGGWAGFLLAQLGTAQAAAVGSGPDGDPGKRSSPSARPCQRMTSSMSRRAIRRDALWAMEEGVRCIGLSAVIGEIVGRPASARLHRDSAAGGRLGAVWRRLLAGAARRPGQSQRRPDALADRERALARQRARSPRSGSAGMGRRPVPRTRSQPPGRWSITHEADRFHLVPASGDRALGNERATHAPDAPIVLTIEGTHGPVIHAVIKAAAERGARPGARLTDARALDPALIAVPADLSAMRLWCGGSRVGPSAGRLWSRSMAMALRLD